MRTAIVLTLAAAAFAVAGCTEREQTAGGSKSDQPAYMGSTQPAFAAQGWKPGDRTSWEQELKVRADRGQNEYAKTTH